MSSSLLKGLYKTNIFVAFIRFNFLDLFPIENYSNTFILPNQSSATSW